MSDAFVASAGPVVVDASVAVEVLLGTESWVSVFDEWASAGRMRLAPPLLLAEVANSQLRGQRVEAALVATRLAWLAATGIETADRGLAGLLDAIDLADRHGLTVNDAVYLQLAIDVDGELATLDRSLLAAAKAEGVTVV